MTGSYSVQSSVTSSTPYYFLKNELLLCHNYSLANSLLHYDLKSLDWVGVWWWWFEVEWSGNINFTHENELV